MIQNMLEITFSQAVNIPALLLKVSKRRKIVSLHMIWVGFLGMNGLLYLRLEDVLLPLYFINFFFFFLPWKYHDMSREIRYEHFAY